MRGDEHLLSALLTGFRTNLHNMDANGWTALHHASANRRPGCVDILLTNKATIDAQNRQVCT